MRNILISRPKDDFSMNVRIDVDHINARYAVTVDDDHPVLFPTHAQAQSYVLTLIRVQCKDHKTVEVNYETSGEDTYPE